MNAVVRTNDPEPQTETGSVLAVIERAAQNPNVDIDKMERLLAMHERMIARQSSQAFAEALSVMQSELPSIGERGQADRYKFALWEDINQAIKPVLQKHGFALTFRTDTGDKVKVTGVLSHRGGHREETSITLAPDASGNKNAVQALGSAVSYGKRYTACALLNLTSHGEDDDAFATAAIVDWISAIEAAADITGLEKIGADLAQAKMKDGDKKVVRKAYAVKLKALKS